MTDAQDPPELRGAWWRCPVHGLVDDVVVLGASSFCPAEDCLEDAVLVHSATEDGAAEARRAWKEFRVVDGPRPPRRPGWARSRTTTLPTAAVEKRLERLEREVARLRRLVVARADRTAPVEAGDRASAVPTDAGPRGAGAGLQEGSATKAVFDLVAAAGAGGVRRSEIVDRLRVELGRENVGELVSSRLAQHTRGEHVRRRARGVWEVVDA